jgi:hypothetical protein
VNSEIEIFGATDDLYYVRYGRNYGFLPKNHLREKVRGTFGHSVDIDIASIYVNQEVRERNFLSEFLKSTSIKSEDSKSSETEVRETTKTDEGEVKNVSQNDTNVNYSINNINNENNNKNDNVESKKEAVSDIKDDSLPNSDGDVTKDTESNKINLNEKDLSKDEVKIEKKITPASNDNYEGFDENEDDEGEDDDDDDEDGEEEDDEIEVGGRENPAPLDQLEKQQIRTPETNDMKIPLKDDVGAFHVENNKTEEISSSSNVEEVKMDTLKPNDANEKDFVNMDKKLLQNDSINTNNKNDDVVLDKQLDLASSEFQKELPSPNNTNATGNDEIINKNENIVSITSTDKSAFVNETVIVNTAETTTNKRDVLNEKLTKERSDVEKIKNENQFGGEKINEIVVDVKTSEELNVKIDNNNIDDIKKIKNDEVIVKSDLDANSKEDYGVVVAPPSSNVVVQPDSLLKRIEEKLNFNRNAEKSHEPIAVDHRAQYAEIKDTSTLAVSNKMSDSKSQAEFCEKSDGVSNCAGSLLSSNSEENIKSMHLDEYIKILIDELINHMDLIISLGLTSITVLIFVFGYYCIAKSKVENSLVAKMNAIEKQLMVSMKENDNLLNELTQTTFKLKSIENNSFGSNDMVISLRSELEASENDRNDLLGKISSLEKQLEAAAEDGLELNNMISELLNSQTGSETIISSVEDLQRQLNEQQGVWGY